MRKRAVRTTVLGARSRPVRKRPQLLRLLLPALLQRLVTVGGPHPRPLLRLHELSIALYRHFLSLEEGELCPVSTRDLRFLCCDIDPVLVDRAEKDCPFPATTSFVALDILDPQAREPLLSSFLTQFGLPAFDIVFCMYITMWIYLNPGDSGLRAFLSSLASLPCYLLVEAQLWKCYWAAARHLRKLGRLDFDSFCSLAIHGDMTDRIIQLLTNDHGMELVCCFGSMSWDRSLFLFRANQPSEPTQTR